MEGQSVNSSEEWSGFVWKEGDIMGYLQMAIWIISRPYLNKEHNDDCNTSGIGWYPIFQTNPSTIQTFSVPKNVTVQIVPAQPTLQVGDGVSIGKVM